MNPQSQRREWRNLSILGWIVAFIVVNSFFGGALLFNFTGEYFAQAFSDAPIQRLFEEPSVAQFPLFALLEGGFIAAPLFILARTQLFVSADQGVLRVVLVGLCYLSLSVGMGVIIANTCAEFYTQTERDWRLLSQLAVTCAYFFVFFFTLQSMIFAIYLYQARIVPPTLAIVTLVLNLLGFGVNLLMPDTDLPAIRFTGGITFFSGDIMLWAGLLWHWSRPIGIYEDDTVRINKTPGEL